MLDVLRKGVTDRGAKFKLAWFKPSSGMNPEHQALYRCNRFSLVRQLKYSQKNENSIDMALFLNGLPVVTVELKNLLTGQMLENAERQYKKDRLLQGEPLLAFKRCLVHFAIGNERASMTTNLQGEKTRFFPFNKDSQNPVNPNGHKTHYLWEDIWQPDTLLELIHNYLHVHFVGELVQAPTHEDTRQQQFHILTCLDGAGVIVTATARLDFGRGDSVIMPAPMVAYEVEGDCRYVKAYVPHLLEDVVRPLQALGISNADILQLEAAHGTSALAKLLG